MHRVGFLPLALSSSMYFVMISTRFLLLSILISKIGWSDWSDWSGIRHSKTFLSLLIRQSDWSDWFGIRHSKTFVSYPERYIAG
jgi:hypothetical protein